MEYSQFRDHWVEQIRADLASFSDPGTNVVVEPKANAVDVNWSMRGKPHSARFHISMDSGVTAQFNDTSTPYRSFLVGPQMADLRGAAQMTLQSTQDDVFIPTKARYEHAGEEYEDSALEVLSQVLSREEQLATRVIMVTGEAGAGKTAVLKRFVRQRAQQYLDGQSVYLPIYIDAQGRALARLNEALAIELQDLRAALTYHSVATLTRRDALVPIIDGFDELLGVSGYDDAFSSFAAFLDQLQGSGQIIASARSSYYEEEFIERADKKMLDTDQAWNQTPITVLGWNSTERQQYIDAITVESYDKTVNNKVLSQRLEAVFSGPNQLLGSKPLFVARTAELLRTDHEFSPGDDLLERLVAGFIERERNEKLLDRNHNPLLNAQSIEQLMEELAEEMWNQETREIDRRSVREVAEYVLSSENLDANYFQIVIERMPTFAFLSSSETRGSVGFEHELFFSYFLSKSISEKVREQQTDLRPVLGRSNLPVEVTERVATEIVKSTGGENTTDVSAILGRLCGAASKRWRKSEQVRENSGAITRQIFKQQASCGQAISEDKIHSLSFAGGDFQGVRFTGVAFVGVQFKRNDLRKCRFEQCLALDTIFQQPIVQIGETWLDIQDLNIEDQVLGITRFSADGTETVFEPRKMVDILAQCGAPVTVDKDITTVRNVPEYVVELIERLIRAYRKANPVCEAEDHLRGVLESPYWDTVRDQLLKHGLVAQESRATSGPSRTFLRRRFRPEHLMAGQRTDAAVPSEIAEFWRDLEAEFGQK